MRIGAGLVGIRFGIKSSGLVIKGVEGIRFCGKESGFEYEDMLYGMITGLS
jgi:hypothetical protein